MSPLSITTELMIDGSWEDISADVYDRDPVRIVRGRADEGSRVDPSRVQFTLNNRNGKWTPKNVRSEYYGKFGRNTPVRISVNAGSPHLILDGDVTGFASTPDHASLDITGDLDLRVEAAIDWHDPTMNQVLLSKWDQPTGNKSYSLRMFSGFLYLAWSTDGATNQGAWAQLPRVPRRAAVRATLQVNDAGNIHSSFYWATSLDGEWIKFGETVTAGTTSVFAGAAPLTLGGSDPTTTPPRTPAVGIIYGAEVRNGVGGTIVSKVDTTTSTISDTTGKAWTVNGTAVHSNKRTRFVGEMVSWPTRWDLSGADVYSPVEAAGLLRRMGQGSTPLQSPMRREFGHESRTDIVAYWPLEDGSESRTYASAFATHPPLVATGDVEAAAFSDYDASDPLPVLNSGRLDGSVPYYPTTGETATRLYLRAGAAPASDVAVFSLVTTGTARSWIVFRTSAGYLILKAYDADTELAPILISAPMAPSISGMDISLGLDLTQNGSNVDWRLYYLDSDLLVYAISGTLTGRTVGRVQRVTAGQGDNGSTAIGHFAIATALAAWTNTGNAMNSWKGEYAGNRIMRIAREESVPVFVADPDNDSNATGPQGSNTVLDIMQSAADADMGILYEQREASGIGYRAHSTLMNQSAALTLDYSAGQVAASLEPAYDDQAIRNDVTVSRDNGSEARAMEETGPMSVLEPPLGAGRYADSLSLNLNTDAQLVDAAGWRVHLGTWDEFRYRMIAVNLMAAPELTDQATGVDIGDRVAITNPPEFLPVGAIDQLAQGYEELISLAQWELAFNTTPYGPWEVGVTDVATQRADTEGSELAQGVTDSATTLMVLTTAGPLWTTDAADLPFDLNIGGEHVTVTGIANAASDAFGRTVSNGWGSLDSGQAWTSAGGAASDFSVSSGLGRSLLTSVNVSRRTSIASPHADVDIYCDMGVTAIATGAPIGASTTARMLDSNNMYLCRLDFQPAGVLSLQLRKRVAGVESFIGVSYTVPFTYLANTRYRTRFKVEGNRLMGKVWQGTDVEPNTWHVETTDTDLTSASDIGTRSISSTGNTNVSASVIYDNFLLANPQRFTVTRGVGGPTLAHEEGVDVRLATPVYAAF